MTSTPNSSMVPRSPCFTLPGCGILALSQCIVSRTMSWRGLISGPAGAAARRAISVDAYTDPSLLLGPGIRQPGRQGRRGELGGGVALDDGRDDPRRHEGEPRETANVPFGLSFAPGDVGEALTVLDLLDPLAGLGH